MGGAQAYSGAMAHGSVTSRGGSKARVARAASRGSRKGPANMMTMLPNTNMMTLLPNII